MQFKSSAYQRLPSWVLGFHGCDEEIAREALNDPQRALNPSNNEYDWLGDGVYFWENDPNRAMEFAELGTKGRVTKGKIKNPFVIGAIIDLGLCCNLFDRAGLLEMQEAHVQLKEAVDEYGLVMSKNNGKLRELDQDVIAYMHDLRERMDLPRYQTVRCPFIEGKPLYTGTEICDLNHIQIAVRDPSCIKGFFLPRDV